MKLISWNVNGLRSITRKGLLSWLTTESPDILCLQETKAHPNQLIPDLTHPLGYSASYASAEKKGYSGVAVWTRSSNHPTLSFSDHNSPIFYPELLSTPRAGIQIERFDNEGRILTCDYKEFSLVNCYFPNSQRELGRLDYKLDFYDSILQHCNHLRAQRKRVIVCGDFNTAHQELDLARPKQNYKNSGFLREERDCLDRFVQQGYVDAYRHFHSKGNNYTWWSYQFDARRKNIGWRIDYFFVSQNLLSTLENCYHLPNTTGSDHCPVVLQVKNM